MVIEDRFLRFYDSDGNRLLTQLEYEQAEKEQAQAEMGQKRVAREAAERRIAELEAKLRALESGGDNSDSIS